MQSVVDCLSRASGFNTISIEELEALATQAEFCRFADGEHIIKRGDPGDSMHVLNKGRVRVPLVEPSTGALKMVVHLGPGDIIGEMALLTGAPRNADVIAEGPVETVTIRKELFDPFVAKNPGLARFLTEILGKRLEEGGSFEWVGKYRLLGKLGEGATSKVYQGLHPTLNRVVAIKMLSHALAYDQSFKDRFLQEARTIAGLTHPNIVQIYDTEEQFRTYFIVMEKVAGTDLAKLLKVRKILAPSEAMDILSQMAGALAYAHKQGIVHRDVKPANCAVDKDGNVKLMDFGIARRIQKTGNSKRAKMVEGTPRYLAPEAAVGKPVDGRADIYSLGIMAYEMVTGRVPFYSDTIKELLQMHVRKRPQDVTQIRSGLPEGLVKFIHGALIKRPDERLTDWDQIKELLGGPAGGDAPVKPGPSVGQPSTTDIVTVSYPSGSSKVVGDVMGRMLRQLAALPGVSLTTARAVPVSIESDSEKAEGGIKPTAASQRRPAKPAPPDGGGPAAPAPPAREAQRVGGNIPGANPAKSSQSKPASAQVAPTSSPSMKAAPAGASASSALAASAANIAQPSAVPDVLRNASAEVSAVVGRTAGTPAVSSTPSSVVSASAASAASASAALRAQATQADPKAEKSWFAGQSATGKVDDGPEETRAMKSVPGKKI